MRKLLKFNLTIFKNYPNFAAVICLLNLKRWKSYSRHYSIISIALPSLLAFQDLLFYHLRNIRFLIGEINTVPNNFLETIVYTFIPPNNPNILTLHVSRIINLSFNYVPRLINSRSDFTIGLTEYFHLCLGPQESSHFKYVWFRELLFSGCNLFWCQIHSSLEFLFVLVYIRPFQFLECGSRFQNAWTDPYHLSVLIQITH